MTDQLEPGFVDAMFDRWLPGAMFPSEVVWLERALRAASVDVVIECGRQDGVSTWTLATMLADRGAHVYSIDFDEDAERLERVRASLDGLPATCVSGDIHRRVPELLDQHRGRRIAVVQDGPKGWEGMATLLAAATRPDVVVAAQHNLHRGHRSRTAFQMVAVDPAFLEQGAAGDPQLGALRERELVELAAKAPNRPVDHTSLGVLRLDEERRAFLVDAVALLAPAMRPWDPAKVVAHWDRGDLDYVSRLRARSRYTPARRKRR